MSLCNNYIKVKQKIWITLDFLQTAWLRNNYVTKMTFNIFKVKLHCYNHNCMVHGLKLHNYTHYAIF